MAAAGRGGAVDVADVFSTDLYTGNGTSQSIVSGIDLSGEGGLVMTKSRSLIEGTNFTDTERGAPLRLRSNLNDVEASLATGLTAFLSTGHTYGSNSEVNGSGATYASWTFRIAPKFFDVVTYTGNWVSGSTSQDISHNLGVVPGLIIVKNLDTGHNWAVYHRSISGDFLQLNLTDAAITSSSVFGGIDPTATTFRTGSGNLTNTNGVDYVAYLFAHDDSASGIIQCGSYTGNGSTVSVDLGWQPQWVIVKKATATGNWFMFDSARGMGSGNDPQLEANTSDAENSSADMIEATSTGFTAGPNDIANSGETFVYAAIRAES